MISSPHEACIIFKWSLWFVSRMVSFEITSEITYSKQQNFKPNFPEMWFFAFNLVQITLTIGWKLSRPTSPLEGQKLKWRLFQCYCYEIGSWNDNFKYYVEPIAQSLNFLLLCISLWCQFCMIFWWKISKPILKI